MELEVNGERREFEGEGPMSVAALLERLGIEQTDGLAVAVDAEVVVRGRWEEARVDAGAEVEIIRATQGG